jgi:anti-sigma B factor antagonist
MIVNNEIVSGFDDEKNGSVKLRLHKIEGMSGGLVIYATGYIDTYNSEFFRKHIEKAVAAGYVRIVFEMSGVNYLSSAGIGAFTYLQRMAKPRNGDMVLNHVQPKVYEIFHLLGFSQFFTFKQSLDESIAYLSAHLESPVFPKLITCPICRKKLKASRAGRFRCIECKTVIVIDEATSVLIG